MGSDKVRSCTGNAMQVSGGGLQDDVTSTHLPTFGTQVAGATYEKRLPA